MNTIQAEWADFEKKVMPKNASSIQRQEMRRAFYAGAGSVMKIAFHIGDNNVSEDAGMMVLEGINQELVQFGADILNGRA